jgi:pyruvate/2-oxoglutarate dehydrogenase complex dihydrolipoamide acyltransferase (E2) component
MAVEIKLPKFGTDTQDGTILKCLVKVGDYVKKGDIIFEIETDKATLEMESSGEGFVKAVIAEENQTLKTGSTLMILGGENEKVDVAKFSPAIKNAEPSCCCKTQPVLDGVAEMSPEKMLFSKQNIPCFYLSINADVTDLLAKQEAFNKTSSVTAAIDDFLIRAVCICRKVPASALQLAELRLSLKMSAKKILLKLPRCVQLLLSMQRVEKLQTRI